MQEIIISVVSVVATALATWLVRKITSWIDSKIKDTKGKTLLLNALSVVTDVVKATYQTYVQSLKNTNAFTEEAQKNALEQAKNTAIEQMTNETKDYISNNFGEVESWVQQTIESVLYDLKNK